MTLRCTKGQAILELTLVLPILLLILMATISIGMLIFVKINMVYACYQGVELGSEIWSDPEKTEAEKKKSIKDATIAAFNFTGSDDSRQVYVSALDDELKVRLECKYTLILPFVEFLINEDGGVKLKSEASYVIRP